MKKFVVSESDKIKLQAYFSKAIGKLQNAYDNDRERFGSQSLLLLKKAWCQTAVDEAIFKLLEQDGLACISKERDDYYTFSDHEGDCFNPEVNSNIDPEQLKKERKREMARFNRQGVWYHSLVVMGEHQDSIGGFVGNDFYGSGYDNDFYHTAIEKVAEQYPEYIEEAKACLAEWDIV